MATQVVLAVAWAKKQVGSYAYNKRCQAFVADCFSKGAGMTRKSASSAKAACNLWRVSTNKNNIPFGAAVYFDSPTAPAYGHVGLYIGDGQVVHAFGSVKIMSISAIISAGCAWKGWGWNGGVKPSGAGSAASNTDGDGDTETETEPVIVHIPQTEKIYTVYKSDTKNKPPDAYQVAWKSVNATRYRNITDRVGNLKLKDDAGSVCVELTFDVLEGFADYYLGTLPIVCGDTVTVTNTASGVCIFFGQVQEVSGSFRGELSVSCLDLGRLLTTNDVILQCNNVAAKTALTQLAAKLGIQKFSCPNLVSSVYEVYKDNAATIAQGILETVTAENGVPYFLRMMWDTLVVLSFAKTPINAYCRPADNLLSFDVLSAPADLSIGYSIDDLRNHVVVYSDNDNAVGVRGVAENAASIARYGRRTALETFSDKDTVTASYKARKVLAAKNIIAESVSLSCYGSDAVVAGCRLSLSLPEVSGEFWVESVTHDLGTPHRMALTLRRAR